MELVQHTGVSYRQLDYWIRAGYVKPMGDPGPGTGNAREFSWVQVQIATWMARLVKAGFTPAAAARIASPDTQACQAALAALQAGWNSTEESA